MFFSISAFSLVKIEADGLAYEGNSLEAIFLDTGLNDVLILSITEGTCNDEDKAFLKGLTSITDLSIVDGVVFPDFADTVASHASLQTITLGGISTLTETSFQGCTSLKSVEVTKLTAVPSKLCQNLDNLESIHFPNAILVGDDSFHGCSSLTNLYLPLVEEIGANSFVNVPSQSFDFPKLTRIGVSAFNLCPNVQTIAFTKVSLVTAYAFAGCTHLTQVSLDTCVKVSSSAFSKCSELVTLAMPNIQTIESSAFYSCTSLKTVSFPACTKLGRLAFTSCSSLTKADFEQITLVPNSCFESCRELETVNIPKAIEIGGNAFSGCSKLKTADFSLVTQIGPEAFIDCKSISSINYPECVEIGRKSFGSCTQLETVVMPKVMTIPQSAFIGTKISDLSFFKGDVIGQFAFSECTAITKLELSSVVRIDANAFDGCTGIVTVELPSVTHIGQNAFEDCTGVTYFSALALDSFPQTLASCPQLQEISLAVDSLPEAAFLGLEHLVKVSLDNLSTLVGTDHFSGCKKLEAISMRNLSTVNPAATSIFTGCESLTNISLPSRPPKTFAKGVFPHPEKLKLVLPSPSDLSYYDADISIEGDVAKDSKWCGIELGLSYKDNDHKWVWYLLIVLGVLALIGGVAFYLFKSRRKTAPSLSGYLVDENDSHFT